MAEERRKSALELEIEERKLNLDLKYAEFKATQDINELEEKAIEIQELEEELLIKQLDLLRKQGSIHNQIKRSLTNQLQQISGLNKGTASLSSTFSSIYSTLMSVDKSTRQTTLTLGIAGARSELLRTNFERTAGYAARLGGSVEDLEAITTGFADQTGRARVLSEETLKNIVAMGKGTGLGIQGATELASQYHLIGVDAQRASEHTLGILEASERMGVSASKVLSEINKNFSRLRTFTFIQGVKGFAKMATYAEKMRIDMGQALDSAEAARRLDNAIEMAAQLQVMGGEFAKTDPFELLFLARNDPAQYTKKINEMTKGVISFRKMADGTYEHFFSPADRDRLTRAAEVLGLQSNELIEQSRRMAEIQKIRQQIGGMGLSGDEVELIEGISKFNSETGKFVTHIDGTTHNLEKLTRTQLKSFALQAKNLEDRAKDAQTFDEALAATINELKTVFLPILRGINDVLQEVRPLAVWVTKKLSDLSDSWRNTLGIFGKIIAYGMILGTVLKGGALLWKVVGGEWVTNAIKRNIQLKKEIADRSSAIKLENQIRMASARSEVSLRLRGARAEAQIRSGAAVGGATSIPRTTSPLPTTSAPIPPSTPTKAPVAGRGMGMLRGGLGIGGAAVGIGAGIGLAAVGISKLAEAMKELDPRQAELLRDIAMTLSISFAAAAIGIMAFGAAASVSWGPLLALGAAVALIGVGIGFATLGISKMAEAFSKLSVSQVVGLTVSFIGLSTALTILGIGVMKLGFAGKIASGGLLIVAGAIALIGGGIALMGYGINKISESFGNLGSNLKNVGNGLGVLHKNIASLNFGDTSTSLKEISNALKEFGESAATSASGISLLINSFGVSENYFRKIELYFNKLNFDNITSSLSGLSEPLKQFADAVSSTLSGVGRLDDTFGQIGKGATALQTYFDNLDFGNVTSSLGELSEPLKQFADAVSSTLSGVGRLDDTFGQIGKGATALQTYFDNLDFGNVVLSLGELSEPLKQFADEISNLPLNIGNVSFGNLMPSLSDLSNYLNVISGSIKNISLDIDNFNEYLSLMGFNIKNTYDEVKAFNFNDFANKLKDIQLPLNKFGQSTILVTSSFMDMGDGLKSINNELKLLTSEIGGISFDDLTKNIIHLNNSINEIKAPNLSSLLDFNNVLSSITKRSGDLEKIGNAFDNINAVMSGSFDDFERIEKMIKSLTNVEIKEKSVFGEMINLLKKPLKVEFADKDVNFTSNITLKLDGQTIAEKISVYIPNKLEKNRLGMV